MFGFWVVMAEAAANLRIAGVVVLLWRQTAATGNDVTVRIGVLVGSVGSVITNQPR